MRAYLTLIGTGLAALCVVFALGWMAMGNDLLMFKTFAPRYEQVRRETFEQSKAYNQGMVQEIQNMQFEYVKATPEQQTGLRSIILHRVADYDLDQLPPDTRAFVLSLRRQQGGY